MIDEDSPTDSPEPVGNPELNDLGSVDSLYERLRRMKEEGNGCDTLHTAAPFFFVKSGVPALDHYDPDERCVQSLGISS